MTMDLAKEKAIELVKKYIHICERWNENYVNSKSIDELKKELFQLQWFIPKECALNTVNEMIDCCPDSMQGFWIDVRREINAL